MNTTRISLPEFCVIGKEGSPKDNKDFVNDTWQEVNKHFEEIAHIVTWNEDGTMKGIWGIMRAEDGSFELGSPVETGIFLAGLECADSVVAPLGWTKVKVPAYEYIKAEIQSAESFKEIIGYLIANKVDIVGPVQNYTDPKTQLNYMLIPVKKA